MAGVDGVPGAGVVDVVARLARHRAVIGEVVDALERQGGAELVALAGVVVDDVEDHLDVGVVEGAHHVAEADETLRPEITLLGAKKAMVL